MKEQLIHDLYRQHCETVFELAMQTNEHDHASWAGKVLGELLERRFAFIGYEFEPQLSKNKLLIMQQLQKTTDDICDEQYRTEDILDLLLQEKEMVGILKNHT